jgi:hypothetical protein
MHGVRHITCLLAVAVAATAGGCMPEDPAQGLADGVDKARAAKTLTSLQTALVTLSVVQVESGGAAHDLVAALQAKDPANRYTTAAPTAEGVVQVVGGGDAAVMLAAISDAGSDERPAQYVAVWQGSGTTMYYAGLAPHTYTAAPPTAPGWGSTLPQ